MLHFLQNVNKTKLKASKLQSHRFSSFSAIRKTVTGIDGGLGKFVLFQYKLNYNTDHFIATFYLFPSIALLVFSHL